MHEPTLPSNEAERMELIRQLDILDTDNEEIYDGIAFIAAKICNTPMSTITIIDKDRQWFKSIVGGKGKENPRQQSFCAHAILGDGILEIPDSLKDDRFKDNPLVVGDPFIRFYAGAPIELHDGLKVGTLCVIDHKPNKLNEEQLRILRLLSLQITQLLDLRLKVREVEILREKDASIVNMLTHELRNPLTSISGYFSLSTDRRDKYHDPNYDKLIEKCSQNVDRMLLIVNEFLNLSRWKDGFWSLQKKHNNINSCIEESVSLTKGYVQKCHASIELKLDPHLPLVDFDYAGILSVLENLISNAAKYSLEEGKIIISTQRVGENIKVSIQDFGAGIPDNEKNNIFKPFAISGKNRTGISGSGLGLSIASMIVEKHGGKLDFASVENKETTFYFTLPITRGS